MEENNKRYEKGTLGWLREQQKIKAKKDGFDNVDDWLKWKSDPFNILEKKYGKEFADWAKENNGNVPGYLIDAGCRTGTEYKDYLAQKAGFENYNHKRNIIDWINGKRPPKNITNNETIKRYLNDDLVKQIKEKISDNKEKERTEWFKNLEDKYGKDFSEYAKKNEYKIRKCVLDAGCKTEIEYSNLCAQKRGFKNDSERAKIQGWNRGIHQPMSKNKNCSSNFGIELGEKIIGRYALPILFGSIKEEMTNNHPGFEFIVAKDLKVNIKCRCLQCKDKRTPWWNYPIKHNKDTDYFLFIGFDTRGWLVPMYAWLIHKDEMIKKGKEHDEIYPLWDRETFTITNDPDYLLYFKRYDITDKLDKLKDICKNFKENIDESCNTNYSMSNEKV